MTIDLAAEQPAAVLGSSGLKVKVCGWWRHPLALLHLTALLVRPERTRPSG